MARRLSGLIFGAVAILSAAAGVESWWARPAVVAAPAARLRVSPAVDPWEPPIALDDAILDDPDDAEAPDEPEAPAETPAVIGRTATGLELHVGPRGGIYHISASGRKVYHKRPVAGPEVNP